MTEPVLLQLDDRHRVPLGKLAQGHKLFLAAVDDDGVITLTPAKVVPAVEVKKVFDLTRYPEILEAIRRARHAHDGVRKRRGRPLRKPVLSTDTDSGTYHDLISYDHDYID